MIGIKISIIKRIREKQIIKKIKIKDWWSNLM
jgi:hypothetical protein